jgi:hypothetical protein
MKGRKSEWRWTGRYELGYGGRIYTQYMPLPTWCVKPACGVLAWIDELTGADIMSLAGPIVSHSAGCLPSK